MNLSIYKRTYFFFIFLYFLQSLKVWFLWNIPGGVLGIICLLIAFIYKKKIVFYKSNSNIWILIVGIFACLLSYDFESVLNVINILVMPVNAYVIMMLNREDKKNLLTFIRNGCFYLLLPSLPLFLLYHVGFDFINLGIQQGPMNFYVVQNHIFFLSSNYGIRFQSYFCEPGHLGMILAFLLYSQHFNLKDKKNLYLLVNLLFTLSLAAYVLAFIAYIFTYISLLQKKLLVKYSVIATIVILCSFFLIKEIPILNDFIFSRLQYDSSSQRFEGDNRISYQTALFFENLDFRSLWNGIGSKGILNNELAGTGVIIYIIQFGIRGMLVIFLYYIMMLLKYWDKKSVFVLLFYCISFYQRSYALWACQIFLFILIISNNLYMNNKFYDYNARC